MPTLPQADEPGSLAEIQQITIPVLILGGGPAGLSAAIELGHAGIQVILIDDKHRLGGKLVLQTHRFFGSTDAVYAGTRGIDIATRLASDVKEYPSVQIWLESTALAVFSDKRVGVLRSGSEYILVRPDALLVATGAREKFLSFPGNTLPGVYGAGAFQTMVNRDMVKPAQRLFIVGGGNVGLIAGYHALQAGIEVVGLVEALPEVGGYKVHRDKLARLGVPILTSHTILSANGAGSESNRSPSPRWIKNSSPSLAPNSPSLATAFSLRLGSTRWTSSTTKRRALVCKHILRAMPRKLPKHLPLSSLGKSKAAKSPTIWATQSNLFQRSGALPAKS